MKTMKKSILFLLLGMVILSACKKDKIFEPAIVNQSDNFTFQASGASNVSHVYEYTWTNNGTIANITQTTNLQGGTISLKVYDATSTEVYSNSIDNNGSFVTGQGTAGTWTIKVTLTNYSGSVDFAVQKG